jgi:osmoprotectant transport system ATP-binding protein
MSLLRIEGLNLEIHRTPILRDVAMKVHGGEILGVIGESGSGKSMTALAIMGLLPGGSQVSGRIELDSADLLAKSESEMCRIRGRDIGMVFQEPMTALNPLYPIGDQICEAIELHEGLSRAQAAQKAVDLLARTQITEPRRRFASYPHQLSGGQRQRVGVARALAVDPPIMLMDEPFGAVDPIVRSRLQDEFLRLQQEVRKTIVFVTHDIDEAIKMGDRIAIFRQGGHLEQYAPPDELLAEPANDFVADFLGAERGLKRLALVPVSAVKAEPGPVVAPDDDGRRVLAAAEAYGSDWVVVVDGDRRLLGWAHATEAAERGRVGDAEIRPFQLQVRADDSLRAALNAMVQSRTGVAVRVSDGDRYEGIVTLELLSKEIS